jgi:hypothetical protein
MKLAWRYVNILLYWLLVPLPPPSTFLKRICSVQYFEGFFSCRTGKICPLTLITVKKKAFSLRIWAVAESIYLILHHYLQHQVRNPSWLSTSVFIFSWFHLSLFTSVIYLLVCGLYTCFASYSLISFRILSF